ncbi:hypothetical protein C7974DRAFT_400527 [Boeremia exigua]|uniref:uncharacterized protein n=1 Tax=Boeremia exigua TaxID=749465 RepID=UPI001E8E1C30|nr:uncharacterized protein C7974DRAFT_400527 [Boeremia exigua]KAH6618634.1 hypothetical protein C7974DRAFT_400527 [Boeremia exigua]
MAPHDANTIAEIETAPTISGPYSLYSSSFTIEFLSPPPSLHATVLMRCTYHLPSASLGKAHPQAPPLHLHFSQSETFLVTQGTVGTTTGYELTDTVWAAGMQPQEIVPWVPHRFWPDPDASEDSTVYVWAHPDADEWMDRLFFENLLKYVSDASEGKVKIDMVQMLVTQHASATALVVFPTAWWLGALRWGLPWVVQAAVARVGRLCGYRALMKKYTEEGEWKEYISAKRA